MEVWKYRAFHNALRNYKDLGRGWIRVIGLSSSKYRGIVTTVREYFSSTRAQIPLLSGVIIGFLKTAPVSYAQKTLHRHSVKSDIENSKQKMHVKCMKLYYTH
jgi:hypothetical protein